MSNDIYDVLKMQKDAADRLVVEETDTLASSKRFNEEATVASNESDCKMEENKAFLKSLGIELDEELAEARKSAEEETKWILEGINKSREIYESCDVSFDDLVAKAHANGYVNTQLRDLLTEEEIKEADETYKSIEEEFSKITRLNKTDIAFLITAIALQVVRQYVIDPYLKKHRSNAGSNDEKGHNPKGPGWYKVPTDKILENAVPFDAVRYSNNSTVTDFLKGQKNHRDVTLGHDPFLGWIFGTANIMTGTITNCSFASAHVKYVPGKGNVIHSMADTMKVFSVILDRVTHQGWNEKLALPFALIREAIHLKSDIDTKHSLPLPAVNVLCPELAAKLMDYGIDTASVGTEIALSTLINMLISMVHRLIKPEDEDEKMYAVRTRKILLISNSIATASNVIAVGIAAGVGVAGENPDLVKKAMNYLDVGGLLVTITRLFSDIRFITKIKEEFINSKIDEMLIEQLNNLDRYLVD